MIRRQHDLTSQPRTSGSPSAASRRIKPSQRGEEWQRGREANSVQSRLNPGRIFLQGAAILSHHLPALGFEGLSLLLEVKKSSQGRLRGKTWQGRGQLRHLESEVIGFV